MNIRIGQGIDFHRLEPGRDLWLGGERIPSERGCVAHSDGDVLLHAICDALLGGAGLKDIGFHFGSDDPAVTRNYYNQISTSDTRISMMEDGRYFLEINGLTGCYRIPSPCREQ